MAFEDVPNAQKFARRLARGLSVADRNHNGHLAGSNGTLRQIGSKLYTFDLSDAPERIVSRHLWQLVAAYLPDAFIADRTAIELRPASDRS